MGYRAQTREDGAQTREASAKTGAHDFPEEHSWEEVESLLQQARSLVTLPMQVSQEAFVALNRYHAFHPELHPDVDSWRSRVAMKREAMEHLDDWIMARRERFRGEREKAARQARAQAEAELQEARSRHQAEEQAIQAASARWDEARRAEELTQEQTNVAKPPGTGWIRHCPVCI